MASLTFEQIQDCIPHRPPMLLVDECVNLEDDQIHCRKSFSGEEHFVQGHYPWEAHRSRCDLDRVYGSDRGDFTFNKG